MYNNRQSAAGTLSNNQLQVLITGRFGDGCLSSNRGGSNFKYSSNSIERAIVEYKKVLLGDLCNSDIQAGINRGFKANVIYTVVSKTTKEITEIAITDPLELLESMDELGLALWMYDDGSLHRTKLFYNINTQAYSKEDNFKIAKILEEKFSIKAIPTIERKKDGREFWYLRVRRYDGAYYLSEVMRKYLPKELQRKCISSETIQKWSKLQEELKRRDIDISTLSLKKLTHMTNTMPI